MKGMRAWWFRVLGFISPNRGEREFDAELQSHLDLHIDDNIRAGMSPVEARRQALIKLGSVASVKEAHRERRTLPRLESFVQDARYAVRGLRRQPGFAVTCIITLALGIGANSAIFSVVNGVLFAPLPYEKPEQLVSIWIRNPKLKRELSPVSAPDALALRTMIKSADLEVMQANVIPSTLVVKGEGIASQGVVMTAGMFRLLGRDALIGRTLEPRDGISAAVLSYAFWQRKFGGDPSVIGRSMGEGRNALTIVGVMPREFTFPYASLLRAPVTFSGVTDIDFWVALPESLPANIEVLNRNSRLMGIVARAHHGVAIDALRADVEVAWNQLAQSYPGTNGGWQAQVVPLHEQAVGGVRSQLLLLLGSVALVLIVACMNVTNLLLARGVARQRELALRSAIGASRGRLLQQVVIETLVLSLLGAVAGLAIAKWTTPLLVSWAPAGTPRLAEITTNWTVTAFTAAVATLCGLVVGLVPGWNAARVEVRQLIEEGSRGSTPGRRRLRSSLAAVQVALAVVLTMGAGLLTRSFLAVLDVDPGFRADHLLTMAISVPGQYDTADKRIAFYTRLFSRLETVPGVISVGGTTRLPLGGANSSTQVAVEGRVPPEGEWPESDFRRAVHRYFETMGIPLKRGRIFTDADRAGAPPVVVINEAFAAKIFANEDPIGRQLRLGPSSPLRQATIVGMVGNLRHQRLDAAPNPEVYVNYLQAVPVAPLLVIRTDADPAELSASIRSAAREVDAALTPFNVRTMDDLRSASVSSRIFLMGLVVGFGVLALVLAAVGVYGVLSLIVAERTREMGIRIALGASPRGLVTLIVKHALVLAAAGVAIGVVMAILMSPLVATQLFGVSATDPQTIAMVAGALMTVALIAAAAPAARVLRVDPVKTLRCD